MEKEEAGTAAAVAAEPAPKERESHGAGDLISRLPDDILGAIISLLPTKAGGRTQALSRRWRHLFFSAPLNLEVRTCHPGFFPTGVLPSAVSKIVSEHPGPARRFCFPGLSADGGDLSSELERWFRSEALAGLKELEIRYTHPSSPPPRQLLPSLLGSASTLVVVTISYIDFPDTIEPSMSFPLLKQLSLLELSISGDVFRGLLSACRALESLFVSELHATGCIRVCSSTLRSIGVRGNQDGRTELLIEDTPRLERILLLGTYGRGTCRTIGINIVRAPKLEVIGPFTPGSCKHQVFQGLTPVGLANSMRTVKVLSVGSCNSQLNAVLSVLTWFPCLEKLYVIICYLYEMDKTIDPLFYDPLHPIECLQTHLKHVVLQGYSGNQKEVDFARLFVLNAKVLSKIEVQAFGSYDTEPIAELRRLLVQLGKRASIDVHFESASNIWPDYRLTKHMHDLSVGDPLRQG